MDLSGEVSLDSAADTDGDQTAVDATLIAQARQGDDAAWTQLVRAHQEPAFRLAYLILGDADDAEDVAQEAFVRAYLKLETFDDKRPFRPWILGIAANLARNRKRSIGRYWHALRRWWQNQEEPATSSNPLARRADAEMLWQAVQQLRPNAQEIVYLRYFLDLSEAETSETLGIPKGTVKSRLNRALTQLRGIITRDFPELSGTIE